MVVLICLGILMFSGGLVITYKENQQLVNQFKGFADVEIERILKFQSFQSKVSQNICILLFQEILLDEDSKDLNLLIKVIQYFIKESLEYRKLFNLNIFNYFIQLTFDRIMLVNIIDNIVQNVNSESIAPLQNSIF